MGELSAGILPPGGTRLPDPDVSAGFSAYVHIPFCRARCGYCDFNTYTNPNFGPGASLEDYSQSLNLEIELSARVLSAACAPGKLRSVFFGGGTPTLLAADCLAEVLHRLETVFGFAPGAEITTEANPESVTREKLEKLAENGFTRISFGMQSAVEDVLTVLERRHTPGQVALAAQWARELGLEYSVDLIYGAPGETEKQWEESVRAALELSPGHISCYALTIERGTKMGARLARGQISAPEDGELADKYLLADEFLSRAGYGWYEISNWARPGRECRHNLCYWQNRNWWGYGPGAHSHINGTRFWNVKHPLAYARRLREGRTVCAGSETLNRRERLEEQIMLGIRLARGIPVPSHVPAQVIGQLCEDGLIERRPLSLNKRIVLTETGRLLADSVIRRLWEGI